MIRLPLVLIDVISEEWNYYVWSKGGEATSRKSVPSNHFCCFCGTHPTILEGRNTSFNDANIFFVPSFNSKSQLLHHVLMTFDLYLGGILIPLIGTYQLQLVCCNFFRSICWLYFTCHQVYMILQVVDCSSSILLAHNYYIYWVWS